MHDIEKARAVRDWVLSQEDHVDRIPLTIYGAEYAAWRVAGVGWYALVSNAWELHLAACRARAQEPNDRDTVIRYELLELVIDDMEAMSFFYEVGGCGEHLIEFQAGAWEVGFGVPAITLPARRRAA